MPDRKSIPKFRTGERVFVQTVKGWTTGLYIRLDATGAHLVRPEGSGTRPVISVTDDQIRRMTSE
jgi:hypothetical protein